MGVFLCITLLSYGTGKLFGLSFMPSYALSSTPHNFARMYVLFWQKSGKMSINPFIVNGMRNERSLNGSKTLYAPITYVGENGALF